jgi:hypothetical protein
MTQPTAQDILMGGGARMFSWALRNPQTGQYATKPYGTTISGVISGEMSQAQQTDIDTQALQTWPDGKPKMQAIIPLQTDLREDADDDGARTLWVKQSSALQAAIKAAVVASGAKSLLPGGTLTVTLTGETPSSKAGMNPIKQFAAQYTPPAQNVVMGGENGQPAQGQVPPAQVAQGQPQYAQPAAQGQFPPQTAAVAQQPTQAASVAQQPVGQSQYAQPAQVAQQVAQAPPAQPAQAGPDPLAVARQLAAMRVPAEQIVLATGLPLEQVQPLIVPF